MPSHDPINHPTHYISHPSGIECITIAEHFNFCLGNAIKYIWRHTEKGSPIDDLRKAKWYLEREIARLEWQILANANSRATAQSQSPVVPAKEIITGVHRSAEFGRKKMARRKPWPKPRS